MKLFMAMIGVSVFAGAAMESMKSPEQKAAEAAVMEMNHLRANRSGAAALALKQALKNPDSAQWHAILTNQDGSVICIDYGAQNGFGGVTRSHVVFTNGTPDDSAKAWNKNCVQNLYDMKEAALRRLD